MSAWRQPTKHYLDKVDITNAAPAVDSSISQDSSSEDKDSETPRSSLFPSAAASAQRKKGGFSLTGAERAILEALTPIQVEPEPPEEPKVNPVPVNQSKSKERLEEEHWTLSSSVSRERRTMLRSETRKDHTPLSCRTQRFVRQLPSMDRSLRPRASTSHQHSGW